MRLWPNKLFGVQPIEPGVQPIEPGVQPIEYFGFSLLNP